MRSVREDSLTDLNPPEPPWIEAIARAYVAARHQKKYLERGIHELQAILQNALRLRPGEIRVLAEGDLKAHGILQHRIPGIRDEGRKELEELLQRKQFWGPASASQLSFPGLRKLLQRIERDPEHRDLLALCPQEPVVSLRMRWERELVGTGG